MQSTEAVNTAIGDSGESDNEVIALGWARMVCVGVAVAAISASPQSDNQTHSTWTRTPAGTHPHARRSQLAMLGDSARR